MGSRSFFIFIFTKSCGIYEISVGKYAQGCTNLATRPCRQSSLARTASFGLPLGVKNGYVPSHAADALPCVLYYCYGNLILHPLKVIGLARPSAPLEPPSNWHFVSIHQPSHWASSSALAQHCCKISKHAPPLAGFFVLLTCCPPLLPQDSWLCCAVRVSRDKLARGLAFAEHCAVHSRRNNVEFDPVTRDSFGHFRSQRGQEFNPAEVKPV